MGKKNGIRYVKKSFNMPEEISKRLYDYVQQTKEKNASLVINEAIKNFLKTVGYML